MGLINKLVSKGRATAASIAMSSILLSGCAHYANDIVGGMTEQSVDRYNLKCEERFGSVEKVTVVEDSQGAITLESPWIKHVSKPSFNANGKKSYYVPDYMPHHIEALQNYLKHKNANQ